MRILYGSAAAGEVARIAARGSRPGKAEPAVRKIVNDVRLHGDRALRKYAKRWDGFDSKDSFRVEKRDLTSSWKSASPELRASLKQAAANIRQFCEWQKPKQWRRSRNGVSLGQLVRPLGAVGCYVPGGRYPLVSTLLMTVIPAQVAGVKRISVASPRPRREVLAAAAMLGITKFYRIGGAHAVAALAYGTESVPATEKIVGPGNSYVTAAKKLISFDCGIDMLAGPTEALVLSDDGNAKFIAADLVAQAEHDPEALPIFVTTSRRLANQVAENVKIAAGGSQVAQQALAKNGVILLAGSKRQAREWANAIAPEHITVAASEVRFIQNAGSVFVGDYSAQAAGDYGVGPNHVLPTAGAARFRGGLSVLDFVKLITVQEVSRSGFKKIAPMVEQLAVAEGLTAHAASIRVRNENA